MSHTCPCHVVYVGLFFVTHIYQSHIAYTNAVCCSAISSLHSSQPVLQCDAMCCSVLQCVAGSHTQMRRVAYIDGCRGRDTFTCPVPIYIEHTRHSTGRRRLTGCLRLQVIFRKRATNYSALLRKMTYEGKAFHDSTPPCTLTCLTNLMTILMPIYVCVKSHACMVRGDVIHSYIQYQFTYSIGEVIHPYVRPF